jgi:predicted nucleic-acid-binding Zn-ribbon protein
MDTIAPCPNCRSTNLFRSKEVSAGGGYAPNYLPGLGGLFSSEKFFLVVCGDCGLSRFFARPEATAKLPASPKWTRA